MTIMNSYKILFLSRCSGSPHYTKHTFDTSDKVDIMEEYRVYAVAALIFICIIFIPLSTLGVLLLVDKFSYKEKTVEAGTVV